MKNYDEEKQIATDFVETPHYYNPESVILAEAFLELLEENKKLIDQLQIADNLSKSEFDW